jgi:rhodanese-related sulfurtransferase
MSTEPELISADEAGKRVAGGAFIVDVRPERFLAEDGHNALATWVDRYNMDDYFTAGGEHYLAEQLGDGSREIVVMCGSIKGSTPMAEWLTEHGYENVSHVDGGFAAWKEAGLPVSSVE